MYSTGIWYISGLLGSIKPHRKETARDIVNKVYKNLVSKNQTAAASMLADAPVSFSCMHLLLPIVLSQFCSFLLLNTLYLFS